MNATVRVVDTDATDERWSDHLLHSAPVDFHQSRAWAEHLDALGLERRTLLVLDGETVLASAVVSGGEAGWTLWRGPVGVPDLGVLAALADTLGDVEMVLAPGWSDAATRLPGLLPDGEYATNLLGLAGGAERYLSRMAPTTRNRVRRARRAGVTVAVGSAHVDAYYELYVSEMRRVDSPDEATRSMLSDLCHDRGALLLTAWMDAELVAGAVALDHDGVLEMRYVATAPAARVVAPLNLVYFEAMLWGERNGRTWLDVSGIATDTAADDRTAAINRFKAGFGKDTRIVCRRFVSRRSPQGFRPQRDPARPEEVAR